MAGILCDLGHGGAGSRARCTIAVRCAGPALLKYNRDSLFFENDKYTAPAGSTYKPVMHTGASHGFT